MLRAAIFVDNPYLKKKYNFNFQLEGEEYKGNIDHFIYKTGKTFYDKINKNPNKDQIYFDDGGINLVKQARLERKYIFWLLKNEFNEIMKNTFIYKPKKIFRAYLHEFSNFLNRYKFNLTNYYILMSLIFSAFVLIRNQKVLFLSSIVLSIPVIMKNIFFWGLISTYFLDVFLIVSLSILIIVSLLFRKILKILYK